MTFQIHALSEAAFAPLFGLTDAELTEKGMRRVTADANPGFPCRVSLEDAQVGEDLILCNYRHLDGHTPYAASHAIYVRQSATRVNLRPGEVPEVLARRLLSVRGFDRDRMMVEADVIDGRHLAAKLEATFSNAAIDVVQVHNAKQGCFAASATRV